jgi:hypothetical protein
MNSWHGLGSRDLDPGRAGERSGAVELPLPAWIGRLATRSARGY